MKNFILGVFQSVVGNIMTAAVIGGMIFLLWAFKYGIRDVIGEIFNVELTEKK